MKKLLSRCILSIKIVISTVFLSNSIYIKCNHWTEVHVLTHWHKGILLCLSKELGLILFIVKICRHLDCEDKGSSCFRGKLYVVNHWFQSTQCICVTSFTLAIHYGLHYYPVLMAFPQTSHHMASSGGTHEGQMLNAYSDDRNRMFPFIIQFGPRHMKTLG